MTKLEFGPFLYPTLMTKRWVLGTGAQWKTLATNSIRISGVRFGPPVLWFSIVYLTDNRPLSKWRARITQVCSDCWSLMFSSSSAMRARMRAISCQHLGIGHHVLVALDDLVGGVFGVAQMGQVRVLRAFSRLTAMHPAAAIGHRMAFALAARSGFRLTFHCMGYSGLHGVAVSTIACSNDRSERL